MIKGMLIGGAFATAFGVLALSIVLRDDGSERAGEFPPPGASAISTASAPSGTSSASRRSDFAAGFIYGRVTLDDGTVHEGTLRWGDREEALWGNTFNGFEPGNPWADHVPADHLPSERVAVRLLGLELFARERPADLGRPFMARFGDIARIDAHGRRLRVTLKSGTEVELDRFGADDLADGVRVTDRAGRVVELGEWGIESIELFPNPGLSPAAYPLHGTVMSESGDFTGLVQWDRERALESDELVGRSAEGEVRVPFGSIRSIARRAEGNAAVTLLDGRELVLSGTRNVGEGNRGVYVDDARYGRVLVSWDAFGRLDLTRSPSVPAYGDYEPGRPLHGMVLTRSGRTLQGRLVFDLDESETTETLDAPVAGVDYMIPFDLIAAIEVPEPARGSARAAVTLRSGETLGLELAGDLGELNAGVLVFETDGRPEYVPWPVVERIELDPS